MTEKALSFRNHEFASVLQSYRKFLSQQEVISDYDVDQSVIDMLLSVMAYNTQMNSVTANALYAESSIDTAILRKNIVTKAKDYGYTPYSTICSKAMADITVTGTNVSGYPDTMNIEKGTIFLGEGENETVPFVAIRPYTARKDGISYAFKDVELYQGTYGSVDIVVDKNRRSQLYEIPIDNIDTNYLEVYVQKSPDSADFEEFRQVKTSINVDSESKVYFLYEVNNGRFGIELGDGVIGKAVADTSIVRIVYLKTLGPSGNGVKSIKFASSVVPNDPMNKSLVNVSVTSKAAGGLEAESDYSIKRNAPKFVVNQGRGVINSDYADLVRARLPYVNSVSVWSGREGRGYYDQFGRIYISANTVNSQILSIKQREEIRDLVLDEVGVGGIIPIIVDVDNIFVDLDVKVYVDDFVFLKQSQIADLVRNYSEVFNRDKLEKFGAIFEHSIYTAGINYLDTTISSNLTGVKISKRIYPDTRIMTTFEFSFMNPIKDVVSNSFTYSGKQVFIKSASDGTLSIYEIIEGKDILVREKIGTVNFETGDVVVSDIVVSKVNQTTKDIRFSATPLINNIYSNKNNVVKISDVKVTVERL
ncbi:baseplate wedge protein [Agrobacterium phage OLIVR5]|uniref:Baseplate wedge protein n=1 Tax=Agrobacterium phage OLIVR5 TaxID=2723773 RepID=A0A858MT54_9CAUD|nr:baseplate wedge protein [Agrobacterium phage OLIVR5]QIW87778.1 baseplate wedge protein [Agrobacterium phage OLIVR5]QIW88042.1 baseplate wedge protein [Agrobacterium phage OLIVR6]